MNAATGGYLRLHCQRDPIVYFYPLLQKGFFVAVSTGNLLDILCQICGLDPEQVRSRIQTLFVNGKPVDDMAGTQVHEGDCLALSAAMPGLVGATMRSGGLLAGFRHSISHKEVDPQSEKSGGVLLVKLFNLLIEEMGPRFLKQGILVRPDDLRDLLGSATPIQWNDSCEAEFNSSKIDFQTLAAMEWGHDEGLIHLEVTSG